MQEDEHQKNTTSTKIKKENNESNNKKKYLKPIFITDETDERVKLEIDKSIELFLENLFVKLAGQ